MIIIQAPPLTVADRIAFICVANILHYSNSYASSAFCPVSIAIYCSTCGAIRTAMLDFWVYIYPAKPRYTYKKSIHVIISVVYLFKKHA